MDKGRMNVQGFIRMGISDSFLVAETIHKAFEYQNIVNQIQESERLFNNMVSNLPGFVYRCRNDEKWTMEYLSDGCQKITGYTSSDLLFNRKDFL